jgi:hypothetical protein
MDQIDILKAENDKVGLVYIYSVIARKLIFFEVVNVTEWTEPLPTDFNDRL